MHQVFLSIPPSKVASCSQYPRGCVRCVCVCVVVCITATVFLCMCGQLVISFSESEIQTPWYYLGSCMDSDFWHCNVSAFSFCLL